MTLASTRGSGRLRPCCQGAQSNTRPFVPNVYSCVSTKWLVAHYRLQNVSQLGTS